MICSNIDSMLIAKKMEVGWGIIKILTYGS